MQQLLHRRLRLPRGALLSRRSVLRDGVLLLEPVLRRGELLLGQRRLLHGQLQRRGLPVGLLERRGLRRQRAVLQLLQRRKTLRAVLGGPVLPGAHGGRGGWTLTESRRSRRAVRMTWASSRPVISAAPSQAPEVWG